MKSQLAIPPDFPLPAGNSDILDIVGNYHFWQLNSNIIQSNYSNKFHLKVWCKMLKYPELCEIRTKGIFSTLAIHVIPLRCFKSLNFLNNLNHYRMKETP